MVGDRALDPVRRRGTSLILSESRWTTQSVASENMTELREYPDNEPHAHPDSSSGSDPDEKPTFQYAPGGSSFALGEYKSTEPGPEYEYDL